MRVGSLFAGYGGLDLGLEQALGTAEPAWFSEIDAAPSRILAHHWPDVPNLGDITAIDWAAVEPVDVLTGGFPCQDVSGAGFRRGLKPGTRSGLWSHFAVAIDALRPPLVIIENVRGLLSAEAHSDLEPDPWDLGGPARGDGPVLRALGAVLGDLADLGYDAEWAGVRAADAGAPHGRFRVFIIAEPGHPDRVDRDRWPAARQPRETGSPARPRRTAPDTGHDGRAAVPPHNHDDRELPPRAVAHRRAATDPGREPRHPRRESRPSETARTGTLDHPRRRRSWGQYAPAVERWEAVLGREAPAPTETGPAGGQRLSPAFVEWMMGLPRGHVTDPTIGLTRSEQLKALGNGVVPQQAALALRHLLAPEGGR